MRKVIINSDFSLDRLRVSTSKKQVFIRFNSTFIKSAYIWPLKVSMLKNIPSQSFIMQYIVTKCGVEI